MNCTIVVLLHIWIHKIGGQTGSYTKLNNLSQEHYSCTMPTEANCASAACTPTLTRDTLPTLTVIQFLN